MDKLADEIEQHLDMIGVTAIEDKLQEGVPEAISSLRRAGMKVWILTGDKQETAVNIGKSCMLIENLDLQYASTGTDKSTLKGSAKRDSVFSLDLVPNDIPFTRTVSERSAQLSNKLQARNHRTKTDSNVHVLLNRSIPPPPAEDPPKSPRNTRISFAEDVKADSSARQGDNSARPRNSTEEDIPVLGRQLTHREEFELKVAQAQKEEHQRNVEIGGYLTQIFQRLEDRQTMFVEHGAVTKEHEMPELTKARHGSALIIDGPTLHHALSPENVDTFVKVLNHPQCRVVVCARLAPKQKAAVVELVKKHTGAITLSIGDGANDVSMIQAAHVGVGISGKEGMQAVNASDYAVAQFRFLKRLLLVHGRYSYTRNTTLVLYFFYKGFTVSFIQLWFTTLASFSDQEVFDGILLNSFNLFWTSLPILFLSAFDRDIDPPDLMAYPEIYKDKEAFSVVRFWSWAGMGVIHSVFIFYVTFFAMQETSNNSFWSTSIAIYTVCIYVVNAKLVVMHNSFNWLNVFVIGLSLTIWWAFAFLYTLAFPLFVGDAYGTFIPAVSRAAFWWALIMCLTLAMLPDLLVRYVQRQFFPTSRMIIQERRLLGMEMPTTPQQAQFEDTLKARKSIINRSNTGNINRAWDDVKTAS